MGLSMEYGWYCKSTRYDEPRFSEMATLPELDPHTINENACYSR